MPYKRKIVIEVRLAQITQQTQQYKSYLFMFPSKRNSTSKTCSSNSANVTVQVRLAYISNPANATVQIRLVYISNPANTTVQVRLTQATQ